MATKGKMLILRGVQNLLHEKPAKDYAARRGYEGVVLDVSGEAYARSPQHRATLAAIEADPAITALYGFSGGAYNLRHVLKDLTIAQRDRIGLVVVIGAPKNARELYERHAANPWELVYHGDPGKDHMDGPDWLLRQWDRDNLPPLGPTGPTSGAVVGATGPTGPTGPTLPTGWLARIVTGIASVFARWRTA